jgi:hypothetical protein
MESIYYVMTWLCHRTCRHCYDERFRPYYGEELRRVVEESRTNFPRIIAHFPRTMTYLDYESPDASGHFPRRRGRIILAGGEILLDPVRESVLYPALELLSEKYRDFGGVSLVVQTTGDVVKPAIVEELLRRQVWMISISGLDEYHDGLEPEARRQDLQDRLTRMFEAFAMKPYDQAGEVTASAVEQGPYFQFFGATPDSWIGPLWPRGRAHRNHLSTASLRDNFCNRWSGGLNFLQYGFKGSEVSVEPNGNVYPCCIKTRLPIGNLLEESLESIITRLVGNPVYEAISMGHPERMGIAHGWSVEKFLEKSRIVRQDGTVYQNLCIGCDAFHDEVLQTGASSSLVKLNSAETAGRR